MAINGETKTAVDTLLTSDTTTELNFKTGLEHVTTELDSGVVKTDSQFGGNVSGTYDNITVDPASHDHGATNYTETEIDAFFAGNTVITGYNNTNWDTAYGWGNHGSEGYLTAVAFSDINAAAVQLSSESFSDDDTSLMTSAAIADYVAGEIPSNVPTTTKQTEWDTAYNAAVAGTSSVNIDSGTIDGVTIGTTSAVTDLRVDNIKIDGNVISSTNTNGDISLTPAGTGEVNISKVNIDSGTIDGVTIGTNSVFTDLHVDNIKVDANTISSTNTNGDIILSPNGSGDVSIPNANIVITGTFQGIDFSQNNTTSGSETNGLLYEFSEGTWNPSFSAGGTSLTTQPTFSNAKYSRVGGSVTVSCNIIGIASDGSALSDLHLDGLPYSVASTGNFAGSIKAVRWDGGKSPIVCEAVASTSHILFYYYDSTLGHTINKGNSLQTGGTANNQTSLTLTYFV